MALSIKSPETEALARELAAQTGESLTRAIHVALANRLARVRDEDARATADRTARILAIGRDAAPRWREPYRCTDHGELLYDDAGLPA